MPSLAHRIRTGGFRVGVNGILLLLVSAILSFLVVTATGFALQGVFSSFAKRINTSPQQEVIVGAVPISASGTAIHVPHAPRHIALEESDFLFFVWFKLKSPVRDGERLGFISKFDPASPQRPGFSVALTGESDGVRPSVDWRHSSGSGRWYTFSSTQLKSKEWYLMAVSHRRVEVENESIRTPAEGSDGQDSKSTEKGNSKFLALHLTSISNPKGVELLGGYDVGGVPLPDTQAELLIGSFANGKLRGKIGPFGVLQIKELTPRLLEIVKSIAKEPNGIPESISSDEVGLWVTSPSNNGESSNAPDTAGSLLVDRSASPVTITVTGLKGEGSKLQSGDQPSDDQPTEDGATR